MPKIRKILEAVKFTVFEMNLPECVLCMTWKHDIWMWLWGDGSENFDLAERKYYMILVMEDYDIFVPIFWLIDCWKWLETFVQCTELNKATTCIKLISFRGQIDWFIFANSRVVFAMDRTLFFITSKVRRTLVPSVFKSNSKVRGVLYYEIALEVSQNCASDPENVSDFDWQWTTAKGKVSPWNV